MIKIIFWFIFILAIINCVLSAENMIVMKNENKNIIENRWFSGLFEGQVWGSGVR